MKILTIIIFSGNRFTVKELLSDIVLINQKNINIVVVEWIKKKKNFKRKKKNIFIF